MSIIRDGTGTDTAVKVTNDNRLEISGRIVDDSTQENFEGNSYGLSTQEITITTGSSLLYIKNTGVNDIVLFRTIFSFPETDGTAGGYWKVTARKNPSGGTLISGGSAVTPTNRNFASGKTATATVLKGVDGSTVTNGTVFFAAYYNMSDLRFNNETDIVIPKDAAISYTIEPPAGHTTGICVLNAIFFERTLEV